MNSESMAGQRRGWEQTARVGAIILMLALAVFPFAGTGLLAPTAGIVGAYAIWLAYLVLTVRVGRTRPALSLIMPLAALATWWLYIAAGGALLGWTA